MTTCNIKVLQPLQVILASARSITITPISHHEDRPGRIDYEREMENYLNGYGVMWDDCGGNETQVGDLFAFVQGHARKESEVGGGYCQIRRVIAVLPHSARPKHWNLPEHAGRNVLILSDIEYEGTWTALSECSGKCPFGKVLYAGSPQQTRVLAPLNGTQRWKLSTQ